MKRLNIILMLIILLTTEIFFGCQDGASKEVKLFGINDTAFYYINPATKKSTLMFKQEYFKPLNYIIELKSDTVDVGSDFESYFSIYHQNFTIVIDEPSKEVIRGSYNQPMQGQPFKALEYKYSPANNGLYSLKGRIEYDTVTIPFEYKFIVVSQKYP